jgi:hypothetical protein
MIFLFSHTINSVLRGMVYLACPLMFLNTVVYAYYFDGKLIETIPEKYKVRFKTANKSFQIENIRSGVSVIGSAGSGKTESVVYGFLKHFRKEGFCGIIHDYKDFELIEMAYPLFKDGEIPFKVISFDKIIHKVNPGI